MTSRWMTLCRLSIGPSFHTDRLQGRLRGIQQDPRAIINIPGNGLLLATGMAYHIANLMCDTGLHPDSLVGTGEGTLQIGVLVGG